MESNNDIPAEATEHKVEAAAEAAAVAAAQTSEIVETVKADAAVAVAVAVEDAKAAEAVAEQIAKAALETERGRQVEAVQRELVQCQSEIATLRGIVEELKAAITNLSTTIAALSPSPTIITGTDQPPASHSPIPPRQETLEIVNPEAAITDEKSAGDQKGAATNKRRRNVI